MKLVCVILAGGQGRRMGGAKPLQPFGAGTLMSQALNLARGYADDVAVAVRDARQVGGIDAPPLIFDDPAIEGPLGGLSAALSYARSRGAEVALTLPCDAPLLPPDLAERLTYSLRNAASAGVAMAASGGRLHPVCAIWRTSVAVVLPAYLARGKRSLRGFSEACGAVAVEWAVDPVDPFANANTPEELAALQR